jgi:DUF3040 family protein
MALSRYEQRVLKEIEQDLAARPASRRLRHWWRRPRIELAATRRGVLTGLTGAAGLTLVGVGLVAANGIGILTALIGYALTVLAASSAVTAINHRLWSRFGQKPAQLRNRSPQRRHHNEPGPDTAD